MNGYTKLLGRVDDTGIGHDVEVVGGGGVVSRGIRVAVESPVSVRVSST